MDMQMAEGTHTKNEYFGIFQALRKLQMPNSYDFDLYEGYYADFYEALTNKTNYDVPFLLDQAALKSKGKKVLELACGSGRLLMHLANRGFAVKGMDLSEDMLNLCRNKLRQLPERLKRNIEVVHGDMTDFHLNESFPLIILSATSISLLPSEQHIVALLHSVERHLEPGGRFVFDFVVSNGSHNAHFRNGKVSGVTFNVGAGHKQFVLIGEQENEEDESAVMNFYAEVIKGDQTSRYFGSTYKKFFSEDKIMRCIEQSALSLCETKPDDLA